MDKTKTQTLHTRPTRFNADV